MRDFLVDPLARHFLDRKNPFGKDIDLGPRDLRDAAPHESSKPFAISVDSKEHPREKRSYYGSMALENRHITLHPRQQH